MCKESMPNFVDELPFEIQVVDTESAAQKKKTISFTELRIKGEAFNIIPHRKDYKVLYKDLIANMGQELNSFHVEDFVSQKEQRLMTDSEVFALGVESQPTSISSHKYINRVVLINDRGDRVLDTLVRPIEFPEGCKINAKDGMKTKLFKLAAEIGPTLEEVAEVVANLVKGKPFVGYHQAMKCTDMGYWDPAIALGGTISQDTYRDYRKSNSKVIGEAKERGGHKNKFDPKEVETQNSLFMNLYDTAKIFNKTAHNQI